MRMRRERIAKTRGPRRRTRTILPPLAIVAIGLCFTSIGDYLRRRMQILLDRVGQGKMRTGRKGKNRMRTRKMMRRKRSQALVQMLEAEIPAANSGVPSAGALGTLMTSRTDSGDMGQTKIGTAYSIQVRALNIRC